MIEINKLLFTYQEGDFCLDIPDLIIESGEK